MIILLSDIGLNESSFEIRAASLGEQQWSACALLFVWFGDGYRGQGLGCQRLKER
jgi:hypothetical protein